LPTHQLTALCDLATEAHTRIQQTFEELDPVVGVSENMRASGVPADVMTIDCLKSRKRILLVLHDHQPEVINYQFGFIDQQPQRGFEQIALQQLTSTTLFDWIKDYLRTE
jgi:hypothetical protein